MMPRNEELKLITGEPIPVVGTELKIYQPTLREISNIGEQEFLRGMNIFYVSPEPLEEFISNIGELNVEEQEIFIENSTTFESLMFLIKATASALGEDGALDILTLVESTFKVILPDYSLHYDLDKNLLTLKHKKSSYSIVVDREVFLGIREVCVEAFSLDQFFGGEDEAEMSEEAKRIAEKMAESERRIRELNGEEKEGSFFARIISVLGVHKRLDYLSNLTIYQLLNQFNRFQLYSSYDQSIQAVMAGAKDVEIIDWYKKI